MCIFSRLLWYNLCVTFMYHVVDETSTFCPQSAFMYIIWLSKQAVITLLF